MGSMKRGIGVMSLIVAFIFLFSLTCYSAVISNWMRLSASSLTLNSNVYHDSAEVYAVFGVSGNFTLSGLENYPGRIDTETESCEYMGYPAIKINLSATDFLPKGTYQYTITAKDADTGAMFPSQGFRVRVSAKKSVLKLDKKKVVLSYADRSDYAFVSPKEEGVVILPLDSLEKRPVIPPEIEVKSVNDSTVRISANTGAVPGKTYKLTLWTASGGQRDFRVSKQKLNVCVGKSSANVKVSMKKLSGGKLNLAKRITTALRYAPEVKNAGYAVRDVVFTDSRMNELFALEVIRDEATQDVKEVAISARPGGMVSDRTYTVGLACDLVLPGTDIYMRTSNTNVKIKPVDPDEDD